MKKLDDRETLDKRLAEIQPLLEEIIPAYLELKDKLDSLQNERDRIVEKLVYIDKPVCTLDYYAVRNGGCPHGQVYDGLIDCDHVYCDK